MIDDGLPTPTSAEQAELERRVLEIYGKHYAVGESIGSGPAAGATAENSVAAATRVATAASVFSPPLLLVSSMPPQAGSILKTTA